MSLEQLWAGWRQPYLSEGGAADRPDCFFDEAPKHSDDEALILERSATSYVMMNAYPYAPGHVLVAPYRHIAALEELTGEESAELWEAVRRSARAVQDAFHPDGLNIGANLGRAAGAGVPNHLHIHVLPRWVADTNFMTAVADTRVIPQTVQSSWEQLRSVWPQNDSPRSPSST